MAHSPIGSGKSSFDLIDPDLLFNSIQLEPGMTVLDLGCGTGNYSLAIAKKMKSSGRIIAIDLWQEGIASLRQSAKFIDVIEIEAHVTDIHQKLPIADASVDLCLMATVLHDLVQEGDVTDALEEVGRVLKPNGIFAVVEFKKQDGPPGPPKSIRMRLEDVSALLLKTGFIRFSGVVELGDQIYFAQFRRLLRKP
jgi:ubiquinone/menaquinone biosynthesis C-methylase UbiE